MLNLLPKLRLNISNVNTKPTNVNFVGQRKIDSQDKKVGVFSFGTKISTVFVYKKFIYFAFILLVILLLSVITLYNLNQKKQLSEKKQFINLVSYNLITSDQSLDEVIESLSIVNSNYEKAITADNQKQTDYTIVISDNQKSLSQIESIKDNFGSQKELISQAKTSRENEDLKIDFVNYYNQSDRLLDSLINDFKFENNILKIIAIKNNQNYFTKSDIWQKQNKEEIIAYYKDIKNQAISALAQLSKIKVSDKYLNYHNLQNSYFQNISATADEITNLLQNETVVQQAADEPSQIEKAYQLAFSTQTDLNNLADDLINEREQILSLRATRSDFEYIASLQTSLESKIKELNQKLYIESNQKFRPNF